MIDTLRWLIVEKGAVAQKSPLAFSYSTYGELWHLLADPLLQNAVIQYPRRRVAAPSVILPRTQHPPQQ